jgi:glutamine synthetase
MREYLSELRTMAAEMELECDKANLIEDDSEKANLYHDKIIPYIEGIRVLVDDLEMIIDDEMWPLPKYRELLFIR